MNSEELIRRAIAVADRGLAAGELPIGAVVALGDEVIAEAFTQERARGRRLVHADLLALIAADEQLGWRRRDQPLLLAVNLEPCVMCIGAAMSMNVDLVVFGLESPGDGGTSVAMNWENSTDTPFFKAPRVEGGVLRSDVRKQFRSYAVRSTDPGMKAWAQSLVDPAST